MRRMLLVFGVVIIAIFLLGCEQELTPAEEEALTAELEQLDDAELQNIVDGEKSALT